MYRDDGPRKMYMERSKDSITLEEKRERERERYQTPSLDIKPPPLHIPHRLHTFFPYYFSNLTFNCTRKS